MKLIEKQSLIWDMFMHGAYQFESDFWDDLLDLEKPYLEKRKTKRQSLYPVFGNKARLLGDFELDYVFEEYMKDNKKFIEQIKKSLEARVRSEFMTIRKREQNERFSNLFKVVEVN